MSDNERYDWASEQWEEHKVPPTPIQIVDEKGTACGQWILLYLILASWFVTFALGYFIGSVYSWTQMVE